MIFGRNDDELSIYDRALNDWDSSSEWGQKELAVNLKFDNRVNENREKLFRNYFSSPFDGRKLKEALIKYHQERVQNAANNPDFCIPECNNVIADYAQGIFCRLFKKETELVNILSLNSLQTVIDKVSAKYPSWKKFVPENRSPDDFSEWLNFNLSDKDPCSNEVKGFISTIFDMLNYYMKDSPYNPVWVTTWESFQKYALLSKVDRWNQIVGVPRRKGNWQIVLKYSSSDVKCLHRPTQLDGGYFAYHFPLPIEVLKQNKNEGSHSGHTMDLQKSSSDPLVPEYIHAQIELKLEYWVNAGCLISQTEFGNNYTPLLQDLRLHHYKKLQAFYGDGFIKDWMPNP
jgi:hypothetical protein